MTSRSVAAPGVTAVSDSLNADTCASLAVKREIAVIPNVLECGLYRRTPSRRCARTTARRHARR